MKVCAYGNPYGNGFI